MNAIMTPSEIVSELDKFIIGQNNAKKAVAIALRNRWRRQQVPEPMKTEITPKNILMIGPTGVGKTEIARRLAKLANSPFIKVEATKFTEVGYVGKDVETIIRDLVEIAVKQKRQEAIKQKSTLAQDKAEDNILDILLPLEPSDINANKNDNTTRQMLRKKLRQGELDDKEINIDVQSKMQMDIIGPAGMENALEQIKDMFGSNNKTKSKTLKIKDALKVLCEQEASNLINDEEIKTNAISLVEQNGIVFLDEIDKIATRSSNSQDVSRQGVQRDLLPLVEGTSVNTKYGIVSTNHILFIASGAFHMSKPSDLIPELQGRFPIRVELSSLSIEDFRRILTEPDTSLIKQYQALLKTENLDLTFTDAAILKIAEIAYAVNEKVENIGARRLHTVIEKLLEQISFDCPMPDKKSVHIDVDEVELRLKEIAGNQDLSRYIL